MPKKTLPKKVDPRVRRTRRMLREALVSLILEKDYASISIKEVTERAEVAYITFYRHFESLDQLLMGGVRSLEGITGTSEWTQSACNRQKESSSQNS